MQLHTCSDEDWAPLMAMIHKQQVIKVIDPSIKKILNTKNTVVLYSRDHVGLGFSSIMYITQKHCFSFQQIGNV